jgi:hypothetical protein
MITSFVINMWNYCGYIYSSMGRQDKETDTAFL